MMRNNSKSAMLRKPSLLESRIIYCTLERKRIQPRFSRVAKLINLLRHGSLPREDDGVIEFWRIKDNLQKHFLYCHHWSDGKWKKSMERGGRNKKRYQYCTDSSGAILYLRALQGHSGRNPIDPSLKDNVLIPNKFFEYIYHIGCAINLHSNTNSRLIPGGQFEQRTDSILYVSGSFEQRTQRSEQN